jgi:hypothetical protein
LGVFCVFEGFSWYRYGFPRSWNYPEIFVRNPRIYLWFFRTLMLSRSIVYSINCFPLIWIAFVCGSSFMNLYCDSACALDRAFASKQCLRSSTVDWHWTQLRPTSKWGRTSLPPSWRLWESWLWWVGKLRRTGQEAADAAVGTAADAAVVGARRHQRLMWLWWLTRESIGVAQSFRRRLCAMLSSRPKSWWRRSTSSIPPGAPRHWKHALQICHSQHVDPVPVVESTHMQSHMYPQ